MLRLVRRYWWLLAGTLSVLGIADAVWLACLLTSPLPGSLEDMFRRIQVGMSREDALAILRTCRLERVDGILVSGTIQGGRSFTALGFEQLPPASAIEHCWLSITTDDGESIEVFLGPGGSVVQKQLEGAEPPWKKRLLVWKERLPRIRKRKWRADSLFLSIEC